VKTYFVKIDVMVIRGGEYEFEECYHHTSLEPTNVHFLFIVQYNLQQN
jgi:hypothetical protein